MRNCYYPCNNFIIAKRKARNIVIKLIFSKSKICINRTKAEQFRISIFRFTFTHRPRGSISDFNEKKIEYGIWNVTLSALFHRFFFPHETANPAKDPYRNQIKMTLQKCFMSSATNIRRLFDGNLKCFYLAR